MGFHTCQFCQCKSDKSRRFPCTSSGDVTLSFKSGREWIMPDMILHYVFDHQWQPPSEFVEDVMHSQLQDSYRRQTRGSPMQVGYLNEIFVPGTVPDGFVDQLERLMNEAEQSGNRAQTKGLF